MQSGAAKNKISSRSPLSSFLSLSLVLSLALFLSTFFRLSLFLDFYSPRSRVPLRALRRGGTRIPERRVRARSIARTTTESVDHRRVVNAPLRNHEPGRSLPARIVLDDAMPPADPSLLPLPFLLVVSRDAILPSDVREKRRAKPSLYIAHVVAVVVEPLSTYRSHRATLLATPLLEVTRCPLGWINWQYGPLTIHRVDYSAAIVIDRSRIRSLHFVPHLRHQGVSQRSDCTLRSSVRSLVRSFTRTRVPFPPTPLHAYPVERRAPVLLEFPVRLSRSFPRRNRDTFTRTHL